MGKKKKSKEKKKGGCEKTGKTNTQAEDKKETLTHTRSEAFLSNMFKKKKIKPTPKWSPLFLQKHAGILPPPP